MALANIIKEVDPPVELTQAEYDALSTAQKNDGTVYFITDGNGAFPTAATVPAEDTSGGISNVQDELEKKVEKTDVVNNFTTTQEGYAADARALKTIADNYSLKTDLQNMFNTSHSRYIGDIIGGLKLVDYNASLIQTGGNYMMRNAVHYESGHTDSLSKYLHDTYGNGYSLWMMMSYAESDKIILQVAYSWADMAIMCMRKKFWWSPYSWSNWQAVTPINHAVNDTKYGLGTGSVYGHVKVSDNYTSSAGNASSGIAASSQAVYNTYNTISNLKNGSNKFSTIKLTNDAYIATSGNPEKPGHLRLLTGETNATSQAEFVFEQDGKLSSRYRTRSSTSASWGAWGSWHYIGTY